MMKIDTRKKLNRAVFGVSLAFCALMSLPVLLGWTPANQCPVCDPLLAFALQVWINTTIFCAVVGSIGAIIAVVLLVVGIYLGVKQRKARHLETSDDSPHGSQESTERR